MRKRSSVSPGSRSTWFIAAMLIVFALLLTGTHVKANNNLLVAFQNQYPASSSDNNASCQLCHGSETSKYNEYGWRLKLNGYNFSALESVLSVNINGTTSMLDEINAGTQPGWTTGANNNLYQNGLISETDTAPDTIKGDLDPNAPPVADSGGPYNGTAGIALTFDGSGSSDPDGTIASYDWTFGDGTSATGAKPTHTYASIGSYAVTLTVTDNDGATDMDSTTAEIVADERDPVADPGGPYTGLVGIELTFDGTGSFDPDGGEITAYDWDFGDGNVDTGARPTHTYGAAGTYTVTLTVVDDEGVQSAAESTTAVIDVPRDPVADANGPYEGFEGVELTLDGSGSSDPDGGAIVEYSWDFGDGTPAGTGLNPTHTYATAGTYTITLTVKDDEGATGTDTAEAVIAVPPDNTPPEADAGGPYKGTAGNPVNFDGSASSDPDGNIVQYDWYWGDGSAALDAGPTPTHVYKASGKYDVELKVTDDDGDSDSGFTLVEVTTSSSNGGCTIGGRGASDPTLPLLVLVALLYLARRRTCQARISDQD